ncbi:uncharacterized protein L203_106125 [Cryptococcus depauperatus CBS 7841]|uniref:Uncharacterized protein n=1 Tax=Cryptococcus depauperatus CBS 7841 TaxID=1295531 RepID=A0A1E3IVT6_9TREE|nr:hypothetical protein L203_00832 [Cryptococcus depauperatus CBS 7841]
MQLGRYSVSTLLPPPIYNIRFSPDNRFFAVAVEKGFEIWKTWPLGLVRRRVLPGTLSLALILPHSPLLVLQGGGVSPLYAPNKVVIYNDKLGEVVAEIEFGERARGIVARRGMICIALLRKVVGFEYGFGSSDVLGKGKGKALKEDTGFWIKKLGEWETCKNNQGLMAISTAPDSTLLALPGRQAGHVQLIPLPPCPVDPAALNISSARVTASRPTFRSPIILAHTHPLSTLVTTPSGSLILTTSERGTLVRVWDTAKGRLEKELRRGVDPAEVWGVGFEGDGKDARVVGWSDKGTIHVWGDESAKAEQESLGSSKSSAPSLTNILSRNLPLPKYFKSITSIAQYHLPRKNPHAFSAALGAAGVPSMSMREAVETDSERSEKFVVTWLEVQVAVSAERDDSHDGQNRMKRESEENEKTHHHRRSSDTMGGVMCSGGGSLPMGSRIERLSLGPDGTNKTATPSQHVENSTLAKVANGATMLSGKGRERDVSSSSRARVKSHPTHQYATVSQAHLPSVSQQPRTEKQKQLIAITYSGDWYRLKVPVPTTCYTDHTEERKEKIGKCELVEYRRLGVGGGGW